MAEKKNELAEQKQPVFSVSLTNDLDENQGALPMEFNKPRFVQNCVAYLNGNEPLMAYAKQYGIQPIKAGMLRGAYLGLDALNKEFYLIPYQGKLDFQMDWRGCIKLIKKYSAKPVSSVTADVVRQGDLFEFWEEDGVHHYKFKPLEANDGAIKSAFAVVKYTDGTVFVERMTLAQMENTRQSSKAKNSPAWSKFTEEMYKKTVIHRMAKRIPLDFDTPMQREIFDSDMAINTEVGKIQQEYHDFDEEPQAEEVVVESTVIEDVDLPDFMKG